MDILLYIILGALIIFISLFVFIVIRRKGNKTTSTPINTVEGSCKPDIPRRASKFEEYVSSLRFSVEDALKQLSLKYNASHYITESERVQLCEQYDRLYNSVCSVMSKKAFKSLENTELFFRFHKAISCSEKNKASNNSKFIDYQKRLNKDYFDTILKYPLDEQQREAIVTLEDNVLVISSAGSGKTMTTVGKVRYLIDKQHIDPKKILLITFTRKAASSLSERLGENNLKCLTFHKLALEIIADSQGTKPSISDTSFAAKVYHYLMDNNVDFHHDIAGYVLRSRYKMKSQFDYETMDEYVSSRKAYGKQSFFNDMDGRVVFCKSDEESQICDWLGERNISFRYEEDYEYQTLDLDYRQYKPDFSIYFKDINGITQRVYLEHFALNANGHVPKWFGDGTAYSQVEAELNYHKGIEWKRQLHREKGTILIETRSADFHSGNFSAVLLTQLKMHGYVESPVIQHNNYLSRELAHQEESILSMLTAFTFLYKSKGLDTNQLDSFDVDLLDRFTFEHIVKPFVSEYAKQQKEANEIDFVDAIIQATEICKTGDKKQYDYILVDEFQDISLDRYKFLQALRTDNPKTKLFCVGDDWQSIYRFAGSDMSLFKDFAKYFGYTKECRMETTYRFGEPLIHQSTDFILKNPDQKPKSIKSFQDNSQTRLEFVSVIDKESTIEKVIQILRAIPRDKEVLILGRYSSNVNVFKASIVNIRSNGHHTTLLFEGREISYLTVHQSKGLESDYVILLGCDSGSRGFPSEIDDAPILRYVLSAPDGYAFGEERRLFYVGLTRAREVTYVIYNSTKPSSFISEFTEVDNSSYQGPQEYIPQDQLCPRCQCGKIIEKKRGKAINGNPYAFYVCSNERYGCDYKETRFVNLNQRYRKHSNK